jgi:uncharacterized protein YodC (DUF2158 family)
MTNTSVTYFKIGDVVKLQSGGPHMTISQLPNPSLTTKEYGCAWFAAVPGAAPQFVTFNESMLELVTRVNLGTGQGS